MSGRRPYCSAAVSDDYEKGPFSASLSVVLPAYNSAAFIANTISSIRDAVGGAEILVVDDGSTDGTAERATEAGADEVIRFGCNKGKGAAVKAGMLAASGDVRVFTDADLAYSADHIVRMHEAITGGADGAYGNRRLGEADHDGALRSAASQIFSIMTKLIVPLRSHDSQCGLKGFRSEAAEDIFGRCTVDGFAFDVEVMCIADILGLDCVEIAASARSPEGSTVRLIPQSMRMLTDVWRIRRQLSSGAYGGTVSNLRSGAVSS